MKLKFLLCFVLFLTPLSSFAQQFDEKAVQELLSHLEQAIVDKDAAAYAALLSDDVIVTTNYRASGQTRGMTLNKSGYIEAMKQVWATSPDYTFSKSNVTVTVFGPTNAVVTATVFETATIRGHTIHSTTDETITVEFLGNKPVITSIFGEADITREQRAEAELLKPRPVVRL